MKVMVAMGTRPEAIKLAPVVRALSSRSGLAVRVVSTSQHRELLRQALDVFAIEPDVDLDLMQPGQSLDELTARVLTGMHTRLAAERPDMLVVQGDTTTVFAASLAAFYRQIPVAHVEAGLRTHDLCNPFPEEANRRLTGTLATLHFAPTARARDNLLREGVPAARVFVCGNTVVDAMHAITASQVFADTPLPASVDGRYRLILVTLHRRESFGDPLRGMCAALGELCRRYPDVQVALPLHRNPEVAGPVREALAGEDRVALLEPLDYVTFLRVLQVSHLVLTDSGGVQEEAPVFGRPVLVLRETTERPEAIEAGVAARVGTAPADIVRAVSALLDDEAAYARMARVASPFGDGRAAGRIADVIAGWR
jgi:UDP-N-acetylglucosamine 2-epimerase (non-hydrolysing)